MRAHGDRPRPSPGSCDRAFDDASMISTPASSRAKFDDAAFASKRQQCPPVAHDDKAGSRLTQPGVEPACKPRFRHNIEPFARLIEQQPGLACENGAGDRQPLALPALQTRAAIADPVIQPMRHRAHVDREAGHFQRRPKLIVAEAGARHTQIVANRSRQELGILRR